MKKVLIACLAAAPLAAVAAPIERILADISAQRVESNIRKLVSFGTRNSFSETEDPARGIGAARRWIKAELERCGAGTRMKVEFDSHRVDSGSRIPRPVDFVNVVATIPGIQPESRARTYVVSGHYDSMPSDPVDGKSDAPGANDDASGTAVAMELACVLSHYDLDATVILMAVAGEEQGLYGSTGFAKSARAAGMDIAGMITNDIVGNTRAPDGSVHRDRLRLFAEGVPPEKAPSDSLLQALRTGGENDLATRQLARAIEDAALAHVKGLRVDVIWRRDRYLRGGDHFPFLDAGYPAVRMTEPVEDWRHQHQTPRVENGVQLGDLLEFVDFEYVAQVARVNAAAIASLASAPAAPRDVQMEALRLEPDTTLRWAPNTEPDLAGYRIVWRATTAPRWEYSKDVGKVERATLTGISKDDFVFGVLAYDREGNASPATYPRPFYPPRK
ncbi:MAG TPA: M20/M25/M40 family metallo-hydrolase [Usitatibacter sp.]|nr:M20/M25/M40 family metallo-hydrolase [Usitatibacter sp.]